MTNMLEARECRKDIPGFQGLSEGEIRQARNVFLRLRSDLLEVYNIMRGIDRVNTHTSPRFGESRNRGHR